jgi:hypothetical protein
VIYRVTPRHIARRSGLDRCSGPLTPLTGSARLMLVGHVARRGWGSKFRVNCLIQSNSADMTRNWSTATQFVVLLLPQMENSSGFKSFQVGQYRSQRQHSIKMVDISVLSPFSSGFGFRNLRNGNVLVERIIYFGAKPHAMDGLLYYALRCNSSTGINWWIHITADWNWSVRAL